MKPDSRFFRRVAVVGLCALFGTPFLQAQTTETQLVMQEKLARAERLLAAVVTSDWASLDRNSRALEEITGQPGWTVLRLPEFSRYSGEFVRATQEVTDAAGRRDQRTAVAAYTGLVTSCVECHRYVARARQVEATSSQGHLP